MRRVLYSDERGSEILEFALASTLLFTVIFGVIQGGHAVWRYNTLANLAQEGARYASVRGANSHSAMKAQGTEAAIRAYVVARAFGPTPTVTVNPTNPNTLTAGQTVTVTVTEPIAPLGLVPFTGTMRASATQTILR